MISLPSKKPADVAKMLYQNFGIAAAPTGGIRMSLHVYNTFADIDKVVNALKEVAI